MLAHFEKMLKDDEAAFYACAFSPVALFFRSDMWMRWGVEDDSTVSLTPYTIISDRAQTRGHLLAPSQDTMISDDEARPYFGPIFWVIFERVLPILTHFNTCVLGGCKIGANADTDVDATQELDFDELTSAWFHGMPTFSLKTINFLELVVAQAVSPNKEALLPHLPGIKDARFSQIATSDRVKEFKAKLENPDLRREMLPRPPRPSG